jgi:hypothetical protein
MSSAVQTPPLKPGDLVIVPAQPKLGLGRLERRVSSDAAPATEQDMEGRVFFYTPGLFLLFRLSELSPARPGPWPPHAASEKHAKKH